MPLSTVPSRTAERDAYYYYTLRMECLESIDVYGFQFIDPTTEMLHQQSGDARALLLVDTT